MALVGEDLRGSRCRRGRSRVRQALAVLLLSGVFAGTGEAVAGDAANGAAIAKRWCAHCHVTGNDAAAADAAPPFPAMAADPAYTDRRLQTWLADPHPPMPDFQLSRRNIDDIVAYIRSLAK